MATKNEIINAIKSEGWTVNSFARVYGFNHKTVHVYIARYANSNKRPRSEVFKSIEEKFKQVFGFSIRNEQ